jgi:ribosome-associated translation inhibitor RaiA
MFQVSSGNLPFATALANCYSEIAHAFAGRAANRNLLPNSARKGPVMKLTIRNAHEEWREPVEKETQRQAAKLNKLLKRYAPDLVLLHADIEKHARKENYTFSINLSLPTGTLHATGEGSDVLASVKTAFAEICAQCKKHQALLRKDYEWKRKRPRARIPA